ncbi:hypothetical protein [Butyrivibrio sp. AD3002]|uniref:hypothetical protein n=1 Tax=Butyrivibrio sp. AD3002 TaxID=1280670 RepID=UPI0003B5CAB5|nr:hypothetical protein [Butyrivibrio sp. AD3002]
MKKNLHNAMAKNFQKMVNDQPIQETPAKAENTTKKETKKDTVSDVIETPVIDEKPVNKKVPEPEIEQVLPEPVQPAAQPVPAQEQQISVATPVAASVSTNAQTVVQSSVPVQPTQPVQPAQPIQPIQQVQPVQPVVSYVQEAAPAMQPQIVYAEQPTVQPTTVYENETTKASKNVGRKPIPLMPEEKSSGVLHIRLGELRSYVDFMTQSGKISYQQYISNLIEQDYEKNKDLYLKYKSFMEQLNI